MLFRSQESVCRLVVCLAAVIAWHSQDAYAEDPPTQLTQQSEWEARIEAALDAEGEWEFKDLPLSEVCEFIQEKLGIDVAIDTKALEDFGIDPGIPITRSLSGISNRSFLRLLLKELDLTYMTRSGALWITTPEYAESELNTRVYPVGDLLVRDTTLVGRAGDDNLLIDAVVSAIAPDSWDVVGGPGAIGGIYEAIVVSQTSYVQEEVEQLLTTYRMVIADDSASDQSKTGVFMLGAGANKSIVAALDKPLTAQFKDASLRDVIDSISKSMNIPIVMDTRALEDFGIDASNPISARFSKTRLRFALERLLSQLDLTFIIRDEVLLITTPEEAEVQLLVGLYPVRDLVAIEAESALDALEPLGAGYDFDSLTSTINSTVAPDSWEDVGGPGSIRTLLPVPTLVISQTLDMHEEISELLTKLRAAKNLATARRAVDENVDPKTPIIRSYPIYGVYYAPDEIVKLVMRASEPGTWRDEGGTFVQALGASIVVKHNASGHRQVQKLLTQLGIWHPSRKKGLTHQGFGGVPPVVGTNGQPTPSSPGGFF